MRSLLAVALVAASASAASAGTYVGLGIGTAASPGGDLATAMNNDGSRTGRLMLGTRFGRLSIEGAASRYSLGHINASYTGTMVAAALKYSVPLGNDFEVYGRGGLERTWLSNSGGYPDYAGNGWLVGAGFEYRLNLGLTGASVFVDYEHTDTGLVKSTTMETQNETIGLWTAGVTLAI